MVQSNDFTGFGFSQGMSEAIQSGFGIKNFPNPSVGAVLLSPNGKTIITAAHMGRNTDHAEISIIKKIKEQHIDTEDSTLYITLEPCMHTDTSPSCAEAIVSSNLFNNIVIGDIDPDYRTNGKGMEYLSNHGITVNIESGATKFLDPSYIRSKILHNNDSNSDNLTDIQVISKVAVSNDNYIYSETNKNKYITSDESRKLVHYIRGTVDAVLIGKNTLIIDRPKLNIRFNIDAKQPRIFILWGSNQVEYESYLQKYPYFNFIISFNHKDERSHTVNNITNKNVTSYLHSIGVYSLLVEGGNSTWNTFFDLAETIYVFKSKESLYSGIKLTNKFSPKEIYKNHNLSREIILSEDTLSIYNKESIDG